LDSNAKHCITESQAQLAILNDILTTTQSVLPAESSSTLPAESPNNNVNYIQEKKIAYQTTLMECKIFEFRTKEITSKVKKKIHSVDASKIIYKYNHIIQDIQTVISIFKQQENFSGIIKMPPFNEIPIHFYIIFAIFISIYAGHKKFIEKFQKDILE